MAGRRISASFTGHVKSAKSFSLKEFVLEEKLTIGLTLLGVIGIILLQTLAWKGIGGEWCWHAASTFVQSHVLQSAFSAGSSIRNEHSACMPPLCAPASSPFEWRIHSGC